MIVSVSRRTDIPALYSEWFYNRLKKSFVLLRNPYNHLQIGRVTLTPDKVDGFVFWTKNVTPMFDRINELEAFKYYFQHTITAYGRDVERNLPNKNEVIIPSFKKIGINKAVWRYDPIFINESYSVKYHLRAFKSIAEQLEGYTRTAIISFLDYYRTVDFSKLQLKILNTEEQNNLAVQLYEIGKKHGIEVKACSEQLNIPAASCIDGKMLGVKGIKDKNQRELCNCLTSVDIGAYNTCTNGCIYCYANPYGRVNPITDNKSDILGKPLIGIEKIKQRN